MKNFLVVIFGLLLVGFVPADETKKTFVSKASISNSHKRLKHLVSVDDVDNIVIGNNLSVKILLGNKNAISANSMDVLQHSKGVLEISNDVSKKSKQVRIWLKKMPKVIKLRGNSKIYLKAKSTSPLKLVATAPGQIIINGWVNINNIQNPGRADIFAHWLVGSQLNLYSDGGFVQLAGKVNHFILELDHFSRLDSLGLKANHVWVNSAGSSLAKLMPVKSLNAIASGHSQIAYYNQLPLEQVIRQVHNAANVVFVNRHDTNIKIDSIIVARKENSKTVLN
jgi:hypothetical protein